MYSNDTGNKNVTESRNSTDKQNATGNENYAEANENTYEISEITPVTIAFCVLTPCVLLIFILIMYYYAKCCCEEGDYDHGLKKDKVENEKFLHSLQSHLRSTSKQYDSVSPDEFVCIRSDEPAGELETVIDVNDCNKELLQKDKVTAL